MKPLDTGKAYDQITDRWDTTTFNMQNGIAQHERALAFVKDGHFALDVGCGRTGRFIDLLQKAGYTTEGVDVSVQMLMHARERHPDVTFYHEDICQWRLPKRYDFITAWDSIWHIPLADQTPVLTKLVQALNPGGVLIFSCGGTDAAGEHANAVMGPEVYYSSLGLNGFLSLFLELGCFCRHVEYDQYPELHTYFIVQKPTL